MSQTINAWADKYAVGPAALEALYAMLSNTPAARWRENGGEDPFGTHYGCERAALAMGHLTDDELANAVYLHGDELPRLDKMLSKDYVSPSAYLVAAKDRIRWLSRKLVEAEQLAISAEDANTQLIAEKDARGRSGYTSAMGEAAEKYHRSFKFAHPLPAQWRWEDVWAAMSRAAANPIGEYVDPVTRHWPKVQVIGWKATTVEHLFAVLSQLSKTLCRAEDKQLLARVWRIDSPLLRLISGAPAAPDDSYRQLLEAAMTTASEAMDYVQRNGEKFNARPGDDKLEIVCREFLQAQTQNTLAVPTNLGDIIKTLRTYANGYYVRRDEVLAAIESTLRSSEVSECNCANGRAEHMADCASQAPAAESWWTHTNGKRYQVKAIANTAHRHPNHPITVVYRGEYGHWWTRPLSDWRRSMVADPCRRP